MTTTNRIALSFYSQLGDVVRMTIPRALTDKTQADVRASMEAIIATGALSIAGGHPQDIHGAKLITTTRTTLA